VYQRLRTQIAEGTLPAGARLPSTRALAADLGVSRTTVTSAFEQLAAEGYIETAPGRAARVARNTAPLPARQAVAAREHRDPPVPLSERLSAFGQRVAATELPAPGGTERLRVDFLYGVVAASDFPALAWRRAHQREALQRPAGLHYAAAEGEAPLRLALQAYLARARGLACTAEQIVIVNGSQQALDLCARVLLDPGDAVVVEDPGYGAARQCFSAAGAQVQPVPVDEHGLSTRHLPEAARGVRLAYVTPSHQFPLGGVLPVGRRRELLEWAGRCGAWVIEDDYDGEFRYGVRPIDALQALDTTGTVLYVGTFSKALSPQLRLGYLVLPPALVPVFRRAKRLADRHAAVADQRVLAALIDSGAYERHVRRLRRAHERRRAALLDAISRHLPPDVQVTGAAAGLHLVLWLPMLPVRDEAALVAAARALRVGVYPVTPLYAGPRRQAPAGAGLVLGYASLTAAQIDLGIRLLGGVLRGLAGTRR
jgi:GntR family transcriptional regulator/MocR family aminotransferase